jgi:hypothetical protein
MVSRKRIQRSNLNPSTAKARRRIVEEPANIRPNHRNPKQLKLQDMRNRHLQVLERGLIVPSPVICEFSRASEGASRQNERLLNSEVPHPLVSVRRLHEAVQIMHVLVKDSPVEPRVRRFFLPKKTYES